jgi:signal transduction histidine kinase
LSSSLGLVLNQIRLRQQLQVVHEQDLLGRMSRGLAHDLNNLLTPVQTLLQLLRESRLNQETIDELLPMGLRNLETVRSYVNEALFFSRSAKLHGQLGSLDQMVREAVALVQPLAESKSIRVSFTGPSEVAIEMDAVLIKRLVCNLLSNAIDASPAGSEVEARLARLPKTEPAVTGIGSRSLTTAKASARKTCNASSRPISRPRTPGTASAASVLAWPSRAKSFICTAAT